MALRLYHGFHIPFEIDLLAGGIAASIFGVIFGLPALRMRGLYFALITLMIAGAFQVFINAIGFPDGGPGFTGKVYAGARQYMPHPPIAPSDAAYFRYVVAVVAIGFIIVMLIRAHPRRPCLGFDPPQRTRCRGDGRQYRRLQGRGVRHRRVLRRRRGRLDGGQYRSARRPRFSRQ